MKTNKKENCYKVKIQILYSLIMDSQMIIAIKIRLLKKLKNNHRI